MGVVHCRLVWTKLFVLSRVSGSRRVVVLMGFVGTTIVIDNDSVVVGILLSVALSVELLSGK